MLRLPYRNDPIDALQEAVPKRNVRQRSPVSAGAYRVAIFFLYLFYTVTAVGDGNPYSGVYTGTIFGATDNGKFAQLVRSDGSSAVVYFDGFDETGGFKEGVIVDNNGNFSFQIPSAPFDTATGKIVGEALSGSICCTEPGQFSGNRSSPAGFLKDHGGIYRGPITGTSIEDGVTYQVSGEVRAIVDSVGNVMMYVPVTLSRGGLVVEYAETGGMVKIDSGNVVSGFLLDGVQISGSFTPATLTAAGTFSYMDADTSSSGTWSMIRQEALPAESGGGSPAILPIIIQLLLNQE